jgi:mono/diheme cytochrome c family protein
MKRSLIVSTLLPVAAIAILFTITACSQKDAKGIFKSECVKCHSFKGIGSGIIDLDDVTGYRSDTWIRDQIEDSRRHDPNSGMPRFVDALTSTEIDMLIQFLHSTPSK